MPFAKGSADTDEPRRAILLTAFFVSLLNFISSLNTILTVTTMFFLQSYAITNLA